MDSKAINLNSINEEIESYDKLMSEAKDLLKDIEKLASENQFEKIKICERSMSATNQPTFFPVAFRSPEARSMSEQVFQKALQLIREELLERFVQRYNDAVARLNGSGAAHFSKISLP